MASTSATSSTSATANLVSTLGAGSGINMSQLAEQLAAAQFAARLDQITAKSDRITSQISSASTLRSMISSLASSLGDRVRTGDLAATPQITNASIAQVSKGAATGRGTSTLEVTSLAKAQTLVSPALASETTPVGAGTLTLRFGTVVGNTFTADASRAQVDITIAAGATLDDVASAINARGTGVTAYVAPGASGPQLVLKGEDGAANGFKLEATEDPANPGLAALAWDPATNLTRLKTPATDAAYILDGVARTSKTNTITDAAPGLSLKLTGTNPGAPTTISYSDPGAAITSAMQDLTSALNEMVSELNKDTNPTTGALSNDPGARALRRQLTTLASAQVMPANTTGAPTTLADLGLRTNRDGTFTLDAERLAATVKRDPIGTGAMFTTGLFGVYATFDKMARSVSSSSDPSSLGGTIARLTKLQTTLGTQRTTMETKQEDLRQRLVSRFAKLDTNISGSKSTLSFLQAQIDAWNGKNN
ncbi:flagellar filament capping protein FliD [Novosphingobium sp.]|uniref:flagellar filament capping protein FliD n=1 Tax=Novosphingobium sp. TaxID=1874826 RepID=UPI001DBABD3C|nr:flagellar filament capping protein FliD [Novosphingobium sp.]MBX9662831.1 flagellar filament capping protein FliD [Novosphingobium sp.]